MSVWTGRVDTADGPTALRWHQMVKPFAPGVAPGVALVGFACDEGVRRNGGRVGAKDGPRAIRSALANLAWHQHHPVYDAGDVRCDDADMEAAQNRLAARVAELIAAGHRPLVLGGGHETAWGTFQGITRARPDATVGVINIDAHLDLRADDPPNSGTPFRQIADWCHDSGKPFRYLCVGTSEPSNTVALFRKAGELNAACFSDNDFWSGDLAVLTEWVRLFTESVDLVHLSVDLDVLPASAMPAVSAPAALGVPPGAVEAFLVRTVQNRKVAAVDVVEHNPAFDIDARGARLAARLAWQVTRLWPPPGGAAVPAAQAR